jgi:hypothetical protein
VAPEDLHHVTPAGDQTGHLLWRLLHGEVPGRRQPKAAILLIGTNDLGRARRQRNDPTDAAPDAVRRCVGAYCHMEDPAL